LQTFDAVRGLLIRSVPVHAVGELELDQHADESRHARMHDPLEIGPMLLERGGGDVFQVVDVAGSATPRSLTR
jgi:hypothetical protein